MKLLQKFRSTSDSSTIEEKLFDELLIIVILVAIANITGNIIISFPFEANYKWVFVIIATLLINKIKNKSIWVKFTFVFLMTASLLPIGWFNSGAHNNNVIAYIFLSIIAITFMFKGKKRIFLITFIIGLFISFILIEIHFPEFLNENDKMIQLQDRLIQIPLTLLISYLMLRQFDNAYKNKSNKLNTLNNELELLAYTDSLTGIYNRAFIFQRFDEEIELKNDFMTVIIDIDNFKRINDTYGHIAGDELIKEFAQLLNIHFSSYGYVARYGGDEFIMLLRLNASNLKSKMEQFMLAFETLETSKYYNATFSAGYGNYNYQALDKHLSEVDEALYKAKNLGKNRILSI